MKNEAEILLSSIRQQAELLLLDSAEFYPFGTLVRRSGDIVPLAASTNDGDDDPQSDVLINILEDYLRSNNDYTIAAIATDVLIRIGGEKNDALQVRQFQAGAETEVIYYRYVINHDHVAFTLQELIS